MGFKRPLINFLSGKKESCPLCKIPLVTQKVDFCMVSAHGNRKLLMTENLLFCQKCHRRYMTMQKNLELVKHHPGYYIDVSLYDLPSKKKRQKKVSKAPSNIISKSVFKSTRPAKNTIVSSDIDAIPNIV